MDLSSANRGVPLKPVGRFSRATIRSPTLEFCDANEQRTPLTAILQKIPEKDLNIYRIS